MGWGCAQCLVGLHRADQSNSCLLMIFKCEAVSSGLSLFSSHQVFALPWENKWRSREGGALGMDGFLLPMALKLDQYHTGVAEIKEPRISGFISLRETGQL